MRRLLALLLGVVLLASGCTGSSDASIGAPGAPTGPATPAGPTYSSYVALGDSYSAGPLIPTTDLAGGCARSDHNYPSLVAERLELTDVADVTCSGAKTRDLTRASHPFPESTIPAQLDVLSSDTDLVTVGIGGNDLNLFGTLVETCTRLRDTDPQGDPCTQALADRTPSLAATARTVGANVTRALREIKTRAPDATVVLVGYLRLVPDRGTCPTLPLARGDYAQGRRISLALNGALATAARRTSVVFVDAYAMSAGHDICSADPWVNGALTQRERALAYHPFESGMVAVADAVVAQVTQ